jgi:hypothetical protein
MELHEFLDNVMEISVGRMLSNLRFKLSDNEGWQGIARFSSILHSDHAKTLLFSMLWMSKNALVHYNYMIYLYLYKILILLRTFPYDFREYDFNQTMWWLHSVKVYDYRKLYLTRDICCNNKYIYYKFKSNTFETQHVIELNSPRYKK